MKLSKTRVTLFFRLLPSILFVIVFVGYGLFMAGVESMQSAPSAFYHYKTLVHNKNFIESLKISLVVSLTATILSLLLGVLLTRLLFRLFLRDHWKFLVWIPMLIPHFIAAYLVFVLLAPSGWISSLLYELGLINIINEFPILINDPYYIGVIATYVWKELPFVVLMLLPSYQELDTRYEDVVKTLGGNSWQVWTTVEFPWLWPIILEIGLILVAFIMGAFEVPALLGVTFPKMLPVLAYEWFYEGNWSNRPIAQALMVSLSIATVAVSYLILSYSQRNRKKWLKGSER
ncbi:ABC transporter permease [Bacillus sp. Marseille-P3661]|uniref:ABC transporter permease n=1 Tax=Bacillus sp. Marseille-P3661 TaxID=1936234 RepID=UPI000C84D0F0|nr:ABC transporter permease subunit [Bacillus sp. Marseille-P3661]